MTLWLKDNFRLQVMLYESAGVADSLCRLNDWERCSIPVRSLEIGLKHRQLDTVSFFLKSKENGELSTFCWIPPEN